MTNVVTGQRGQSAQLESGSRQKKSRERRVALAVDDTSPLGAQTSRSTVSSQRFAELAQRGALVAHRDNGVGAPNIALIDSLELRGVALPEWSLSTTQRAVRRIFEQHCDYDFSQLGAQLIDWQSGRLKVGGLTAPKELYLRSVVRAVRGVGKGAVPLTHDQLYEQVGWLPPSQWAAVVAAKARAASAASAASASAMVSC